MDRLSYLGTTRGFAEQRVAQLKRELAEAEAELEIATAAYWAAAAVPQQENRPVKCTCIDFYDPECPEHGKW